MKLLTLKIKALKKAVQLLNNQIAIKEKRADVLQKEKDDEEDIKVSVSMFYNAFHDADCCASCMILQYESRKKDFEERIINASQFKKSIKPLYDLLIDPDLDGDFLMLDLSEIKIGLTEIGYKF